MEDFEKQHPDKSGKLFAAWPTVEEAILSAARQSAKDSFSTALISQLQSQSASLTESKCLNSDDSYKSFSFRKWFA